MKQITSKEFQIYKRYVFEQIANAFNKIGSLDIEYLNKVTNLECQLPLTEVSGLQTLI